MSEDSAPVAPPHAPVIDANTVLTPHARCIRAAGYSACARYLKLGPHALTKSEADELSSVGLALVTIYEWGSPTHRGYFSAAAGQRDGERAYEQMHAVLHQPPGSACYFTVDYDCSVSDITGPVQEYFWALHTAFETAGGAYQIGCYGSGALCAHIKAHTPTAFAWLAQSKGWLHSRVYTGWNLKQTSGSTICGVEMDLDEVQGAHYGQWQSP